jgi:hypothetical protein
MVTTIWEAGKSNIEGHGHMATVGQQPVTMDVSSCDSY